MLTLVENVEKQIIALGNAISWLALFLVLIVCTSVFLRYVLGISSLGFDELQWHIYSFGFMMGFSYCTSLQTHVRNDLLYNKYSEKTKLWIDFVSHVVVLLPFIRQFRIADIEWFQSLPYENLKEWLSNFLDSSLLNDIMKKYDLWKEGDEITIF